MGNRKFYVCEEQEVRQISIEEAFPFVKDDNTDNKVLAAGDKPVVSLVGAGGKTSIMYALAEVSCRQGKRVVVTTTTHIGYPDSKAPAGTMYAADMAQVEEIWSRGNIAVLGTFCQEEKLSAPEEHLLRAVMAKADLVLVEADGAKCMPCKVPNATEPVILPECNVMIGVMGMDALGQPVKEVCFRHELAQDWLPGDSLLTADKVAKILTSQRGTRKLVGDRAYYIVLNKCDAKERLLKAAEVAKLLPEDKVVLSTKI